MTLIKFFITTTVLLLSTRSFSKEYTFAGQDFPPFNWQEGTEVTGGMTEIMKQVCGDLKIKCKFLILPVSRVLKMVEVGELDGAISFGFRADRTAYSDASPSIVKSSVSYMGTPKTPKIAKISDLAGWTIGTLRDSTTGKIAAQHKQEFPSIQITDEVNSETQVKKLTGGRYGEKGLILGSEDVLNYFAKKIKTPIETRMRLEDQEYFVLFSKKTVDAAQLAVFTAAINKIKKDGTAKKILDKYELPLAK